MSDLREMDEKLEMHPPFLRAGAILLVSVPATIMLNKGETSQYDRDV